MTPSSDKATLSFTDGAPSIELPIYKGTIGPDVIDIRKLYGQTGKFTYDRLSVHRVVQLGHHLYRMATRANCSTVATPSSRSPCSAIT